MRDWSITRSASAFLVIIIAVIGVALYLGFRSYYTPSFQGRTVTVVTPTYSSPTATTPVSTSSPPTTTSMQQLTLSDVLSMPNLSETPSLGPANSSKVIVVVYDPECPYCALELNATLPFLYYISVNTSQARVVFLGLPIHEFSLQMLELLDAIYNVYGQKAFVEVLDENYAYLVYWIIQYEDGRTSQLVVPTNVTLIEMADSLGYNVTQTQASSYGALVNATQAFLLDHGISATPALLAFNGQGRPVYVQVGLVNPEYIVCNLTQRLSLSVPGVTC
ncbi:MAG: DsbA family protein [Acidilobus sp.]